MTTLAVPRSPRTSATAVYHAPVDDVLYHCRPRRKIQGYGLGGCEIFFRRMGRDAKDDCHGALSKILDPITQAIFATAGVEA
jgi:hypothetical protein